MGAFIFDRPGRPAERSETERVSRRKLKKVELYSTFSRHDRVSKLPLFVWLNENVVPDMQRASIPGLSSPKGNESQKYPRRVAREPSGWLFSKKVW